MSPSVRRSLSGTSSGAGGFRLPKWGLAARASRAQAIRSASVFSCRAPGVEGREKDSELLDVPELRTLEAGDSGRRVRGTLELAAKAEGNASQAHATRPAGVLSDGRAGGLTDPGREGPSASFQFPKGRLITSGEMGSAARRRDRGTLEPVALSEPVRWDWRDSSMALTRSDTIFGGMFRLGGVLPGAGVTPDRGWFEADVSPAASCPAPFGFLFPAACRAKVSAWRASAAAQASRLLF